MTTRTCYNCQKEKPLEDFYRNITRRLGRDYICKECGRARDRKRDKTAKRKKKEKKYKNSERGRETMKKRRRYDYWKNRHKYTAKRLVRAAIEAGKLKRQPCEVCGKTNNQETIEAHHPDYAKPLEVVWLCRKHHSERHRKPSTQRL